MAFTRRVQRIFCTAVILPILLFLLLLSVLRETTIGRTMEGLRGSSSECACDRYLTQRHIDNRPSGSNNGMESSCSDEASAFGPGQKVISYSMYGTEEADIRRYVSGLEPNMEILPQLYPGWVARVYTNISGTSPHSCQVRCRFKYLFWCDIREIPGFGDLSSMNPRTWRFLPLGDPNVAVFLSRDMDSVLSGRERQAVAQWEDSAFPVHSMRDHPEHSLELLGGMWGVKVGALGEEASQGVQSRIIEASKLNQSRGWDETIIASSVYYSMERQVLAHDSFYCNKHPDGLALPFPTRRRGHEFVGQVSIRNNYTLETCPEICRPLYGKHWEYC